MTKAQERAAFKVLADFLSGLMVRGQAGTWQAVEALDRVAGDHGLKVTVDMNDGALHLTRNRSSGSPAAV